MPEAPAVAVVDYGLGNLFSVRQALERAGLEVRMTEDPADLGKARAVVLPGVGAFGDAMEALKRKGFVEPLRRWAADGRPFLGVCLGMQLLMEESEEFGRHEGLGVFKGKVVRFEKPRGPKGVLKVPQVGWNQVRSGGARWAGTPLEGSREGEWMYFVHSYHVVPAEPGAALSVTTYGHVDFCSSLGRGKVFACQYHPERSGAAGLALYKRFAALVRETERASHADGRS